MTRRRPLDACAVVGGDYGSEGKGAVVAHIARDYQTHVRVGAANAGHTIYVGGERHVLQQLPCAAYANPAATLMIGAGALISPEVLIGEIESNLAWRARTGLRSPDLLVDRCAQIITGEHIARESDHDLAARIGSCSAIAGEGIGEAQAARVLRDLSATPVDSVPSLHPLIRVTDTVEMLQNAENGPVLLEGTQGTGLSLTTGAFPYVTSRNTTASGLAADCGLGPRDLGRVILVCRTYPIRVASPSGATSGPFYEDSHEVTWDDLGRTPERTTVTGNQRRVASFSMNQVLDATRLNSATEIALTFCDYVQPECAERQEDFHPRGFYKKWERLGALVEAIEQTCEIPITMLSTGPQTICGYDSPWLPSNQAASMATLLRLREPRR